MKLGWPELIIAILCMLIGRAMYRRFRSYRIFLEPELQERGCTYVSSRPAPFLNWGPFAKLDVKVGGVQFKTPFGNGRFTAIRIVTLLDKEGKEKSFQVYSL